MKIYTNQIPVGGLYVEGEEKATILDFSDALIRVVSPVRYALDVGLSEGGLFATGTLSVDLEMECVCCLERFVRSVEVSDFAVQIDLGGAEWADLTEAIREDLLLVLPAHPRCDWSGEKLCNGMEKFTQGLTSGAKIGTKDDSLSSFDVSITGETGGRKNPWASLDRLGDLEER